MPPGPSPQQFRLWVDYLGQGAVWPPNEQCCLVSLGQCPQHQMTRNPEALSSELLPLQEGRSAGLLLELIEFLRWHKGLILQIYFSLPHSSKCGAAGGLNETGSFEEKAVSVTREPFSAKASLSSLSPPLKLFLGLTTVLLVFPFVL